LPRLHRWIWKSSTAGAKTVLDLRKEHCRRECSV